MMLDRRSFRFAAFLPMVAAIVFAVFVQLGAIAQRLEPVSGDQKQAALWRSDHAKYLIGLTEIRAKADGELVVTPREVRFDSKGQHAVITVEAITAVGIGNERVERGGLPVRLARMAMYDGSGVAFAAVLHHVVDLLTIEYRGSRGEYHGVVFVLPKDEAAVAMKQLASLVQAPGTDGPGNQPQCTQGLAKLRSITVAPIVTQLKVGDVAVPPEYKALVYERVVEKLHGDLNLDNVYRFDAMNHSQVCSEYSAEVTVTDFKKGNNAVRASTGPLGMFLGTTVLAYDLRIKDADGHVVLERNNKSVVRGENESLDISGKIAKAIAKAFVEVQKAHPEPKPVVG